MNIKRLIPTYLKNMYSKVVYDRFVKKNKITVLNDEETINKIVNEKKSIARFGDGEFKAILGIEKDALYQDPSKQLTKRLKEVLDSRINNLLVCIPKAFNNLKGYKKESRHYWYNFFRWYGKDVITLISSNYKYGNASFTRWYLEYQDKSNMENKITNMKRIWNNRDLVIVEGEYTKMGVGNDLFDNSKTLKRIIAPNKNAFASYNEILDEIKKVHKDSLILMALGPTATILAYDLAKEGYQALDVGHIDIEYEWYLRKAESKIMIEGKFVNEAGGIDESKNIIDKKYEDSIISRVGVNN